MNVKSGFARVLMILVLGIATCLSSQAARPSSTGRLVVQRSATFGSKTFLQLWIDGGKVHNIGPGSRYDQPISAGHHVLTVHYTPKSGRHQPTSMSLTVDPGHTYAFTATRASDQGVSLQRSSRTP